LIWKKGRISGNLAKSAISTVSWPPGGNPGFSGISGIFPPRAPRAPRGRPGGPPGPPGKFPRARAGRGGPGGAPRGGPRGAPRGGPRTPPPGPPRRPPQTGGVGGDERPRFRRRRDGGRSPRDNGPTLRPGSSPSPDVRALESSRALCRTTERPQWQSALAWWSGQGPLHVRRRA